MELEVDLDCNYNFTLYNYYDSKITQEYYCWDDFYEDYKDADLDYNYIANFNLFENHLYLLLIKQRMGLYQGIHVHVTDNDKPKIIEFLKKYKEYAKNIWEDI